MEVTLGERVPKIFRGLIGLEQASRQVEAIQTDPPPILQELMRREKRLTLERRITGKLKRIHPDYGIRNLTRTLDGKYIFDLKVAIDPRHFFQIRDVLKSVLSELPREKPVQAKFYLPQSLYEKLKERAAATGASQSACVAECLARAL